MKLLACLFAFFSTTGFAQQRPNIIYIMSDDHDADAISAYNTKLIKTPNIDRLAKEGIKFNKAFVANSICGPARATLLTGQHSHKNGVKDNRTPFDSSKITLPKLMKQAGYQTAIVGKWHLISRPTGFDYWKILPGQGQYINPEFIEMDGQTRQYDGYATDVITDETLAWLKQRNRSKPFLLLMHHKAPHRNFFPKLKYLELYHQKTIPEPPTLYADTTGRGAAWRKQTMSILRDMRLCRDLKIDPAYLIKIPEYKPDSVEIAGYNFMMKRIPTTERKRYQQIYAQRGKILKKKRPTGKELLKYKYQWYMQDFLACVESVDESIGRILDYLDTEKLTDSTAIIYTSDQGFFLGENGWFDKRFAYEASMQIPLLMRWPGKIKAEALTHWPVQNIDFAPTILDIAGLKVPEWMQGVSLKPLITGKQEELPRISLYYHYYELEQEHAVLPHLAIRGITYKLIYFYTVNEWELYDMITDPLEQTNLINSNRHQEIFSNLKERLKNARLEYGDSEPAGEF